MSSAKLYSTEGSRVARTLLSSKELVSRIKESQHSYKTIQRLKNMYIYIYKLQALLRPGHCIDLCLSASV